jgi:hypothetical protein
MKQTQLTQSEAGIIGIWGWAAVVFIVLGFLVVYPVRDDIGDLLLDFFAIFTDGTDLGNWVGGIVVGIVTALWNFGTSIGYSLVGGSP